MYTNRRMEAVRAAVGAIAVLSLGAGALADSVSIGPIKDNTLFSTGDTSNGAGPQIFSGRTGSFRGFIKQRAVLEFDVAGAVPAGATITGVTLTLHLERAGNEVEERHTLHRVLAEWGEGTSAAGGGQGGPVTDGDATWLHTFYPGQFWTTEGGDFVADLSAHTMVPPMDIDPIPVTWGSTSQMVIDVQLWLDNPDDNHGWLLMGNEEGANTARKFSSREHANETQRPVLTIEYEPATTAPCPGDLNEDGIVDVRDLLQLVHAYGETGAVPEDLDGDGIVDSSDLLVLLRNMGPCPEPATACAADLNGDGVVDVLDLLQVVHAFHTMGPVPEDLDGNGIVDVHDLLFVIRSFGPCP